MLNNAPNLTHSSIGGQFGSAGRFNVGSDGFARLCETLIHTAAKIRIPVVIVGIGRYSDIGGLMTTLGRYPGRVVLIGAADVALPGYAHFVFIEVPEDAPLSQERFIFAQSDVWGALLSGIPAQNGYEAGIAYDKPSLDAALTFLTAVLPSDALAEMPDDGDTQRIEPIIEATETGEIGQMLAEQTAARQDLENRLRAERHATAQLQADLRAELALKTETQTTLSNAQRTRLEAEQNAVDAVEEELLKEQELREWIEKQLVAERKARITLEQTTLADLDRLLAQVRAQREERARQLDSERKTEQSITQELHQALLSEQESSRDIQRQLFSIEAQREQLTTRLGDAIHELGEVETQFKDVQAKLTESRRILEATESEISREMDASVLAEGRLSEARRARADAERLIALEPALRSESEARLRQEQRTRAELDEWLSHMRVEIEQLSRARDSERAALEQAQNDLDSARAAREQAEYAAISEIMGDDGLPRASLLRDLRLFLTRLRERIGGLKVSDAGNRQSELMISELNTAIDILSEIALVAGRETAGRQLHDVGVALREAVERADSDAVDSNISLKVGSVAANVSVIGDSEALTTALTNAILSAIHLSVLGGNIQIGMSITDQGDARVQIEFTASEQAANLLDRYLLHFDQGVPRRSLLANVRTTVLHYGGQIGFQARDDGRITLTLTLPRS